MLHTYLHTSTLKTHTYISQPHRAHLSQAEGAVVKGIRQIARQGLKLTVVGNEEMMTQYVKYNQVLRSGTTSISRFSLDLIRRQRRYVSRSMYVCMYVCITYI